MSKKSVETNFWVVAKRRPSARAILGDGPACTYGELAIQANRIASGLRRLGLKKGDRVLVALDNRTEFVEIFLACMQSGFYFVPVPPSLSARELTQRLTSCLPSAVFASVQSERAVLSACNDAGLDERVRFAIAATGALRPYDELRDQEEEEPDRGRVDEQPPLIAGDVLLYTSGTTGEEKGVLRALPEGGPPLVRPDAAAYPPFGCADGAYLACTPLYQRGPLSALAGALHVGRPVVLTTYAGAEKFLATVDRYRVSSAFIGVVILKHLSRIPIADRHVYATSSLRALYHGGSPCPAELKRDLISWLGPLVHEFYGCTEGTATYVDAEDWMARPGTVGRPLPGGAIQVLDGDGRTCPPYEPGEVYIKCAPSVTLGFSPRFEYMHDPDKTGANWREDYFTVGDIGSVDKDGWLYLHDRRADVINVGGQNVYGAEVEAVLLSHPDVNASAVVGAPTGDEWSEQVRAFVVLADDVTNETRAVADLLAMCRAHLAAYKWPASLEVRSHLPRVAGGKVSKRALREELRMAAAGELGRGSPAQARAISNERE